MASYEYLTESGVIIPDTSEILAEVEQEYKDVFGDDLNTDPSTPQGMLIAAEVEARSKVVRINAAVANQINPNIAGGVFLDGICAFNGLRRESASSSVVLDVIVTGVASTVIPIGSLARTAAGDEFETLSEVTIPAGGSTTVNFASVEKGAIPCGANDLNVVVSDIIGWETVDNPNEATLGGAQESDASFRTKRRNTLGLQGRSLSEAVTSDVRAVEGVGSLSYRENVKNIPQTIDGVDLDPHSIWVCVDGGSDLDIATAMNNVKTGGTGYTGFVNSVNQVVTDPFSNQYVTVTFDRPTDKPILVQATIVVVGAVVDPAGAVRQAILDYADGLVDGYEGFIVGNNVSPFQISAAVVEQVPGVYIQKMEVSFDAPISYVTTELAIALFEQASTNSGDITVNIV